VRVYLRATAFGRKESYQMTSFLGAWFGILPFSLTDLCGTLFINEPEQQFGRIEVPVPPYSLSEDVIKAMSEVAEQFHSTYKDKLEEAGRKHTSLHTISPSQGVIGMGGTCSNNTDFIGILRTYYTEILPVVCLNWKRSNKKNGLAPIYDDLGVVSGHRTMYTNAKKYEDEDDRAFCPRSCERMCLEKHIELDSFLTLREASVGQTMLSQSANSILKGSYGPQGFTRQLENLGHSECHFVEGLTVELLPFQRQTVQWAIERERVPGGVQSYTWAKLPEVAQPGAELHYNPGLRKFATSKPKLIRGGIIAEEMGLGKTVISLSLILQNPAPPLPISGSPSTILDTAFCLNGGEDIRSYWDLDLSKECQKTNKLRGSILSRGTLVVVSQN